MLSRNQEKGANMPVKISGQEYPYLVDVLCVLGVEAAQVLGISQEALEGEVCVREVVTRSAGRRRTFYILCVYANSPRVLVAISPTELGLVIRGKVVIPKPLECFVDGSVRHILEPLLLEFLPPFAIPEIKDVNEMPT